MSLSKSFKQVFSLKYKNIFWLYLIVSVGISIPNICLETYNNYLIFINSFTLLKNHGNPYSSHYDLYCDLYRYSPTFSILIAPFTILPLYLGILVWDALNSMTLFFSVRYLFKNEERKGSLILLAMLPEMMTANTNMQVNGLVTAIMLFSYACFIYKKETWAGILCMLNLFIKIYGFAAVILFFLTKRKTAFISASALSFIGFLALPLLFITVPELTDLYKLQFSSVAAYTVNLSFMGIARSWFGWEFNDKIIQAAALAIVCAPIIPVLFKSEEEKIKLRALLICSVLTFLCAFNQMAESPTYIIAATGAAIWYFSAQKSKLNTTLFILMILFCELAPTDLYPLYIRKHFLAPYKIKALPIVLIWFKIQWDIWILILRNKLGGVMT